MKMTLRVLVASLTGVLFGWAAAFAAANEAIVWPEAVEIFQGELAEISVAGPGVDAVEGVFGKEKVSFHANGTGRFSALVGADVDAKPALAKLLLRAGTGRGAVTAEIPVKIKRKEFAQESFKVPPTFDRRTPEALEEIRREQAAFARVFAAAPAPRLWQPPFIRPVPHEASASSFGRRRIINGVPRAPHSGLDLSSPAGTEVRAANRGRVVLAGHFYFAGGSVVLDHGGALFTMYLHLSEIAAREGALIEKGDVLGLSGATGRVTGAHLHWGARLANARIDPLELLRKISADWLPADAADISPLEK